jgi:hypothetical protein
MEDSDEPPTCLKTRRVRGLLPHDSRPGLKKCLLSPINQQFKAPLGLKTDCFFERLGEVNAAVVQDTSDPDKITLFPRLIYRDMEGLNSCVTKRTGRLEGYDVILDPEEVVIFQASPPFGSRGVEDLRTGRIAGEKPLHGYLVHHNGFDSRTEYVRTSEDDKDFSEWDKFEDGIYFPNITAEEAISKVKQERYKKEWEAAYGKRTVEDARKSGKKLPEDFIAYLSTKDCCSFPRKVWKDRNDGRGTQEYYPVIIRLLPDIQVVYISDFKELADENFWRRTISNLEDHVLMQRVFDWEESHIGLGGAPLELEEGVLMSYHGARMNPQREYQWGEVLLDKNDPQHIIGRTKTPIYTANEPWMRDGVVSGGVIFPTDYAISSEGIVFSFFGAGDVYLGYVTREKDKILERLE